MKDYTFLIDKAKEAKKFSYAPYSNFNVGAALLASSGKVYFGCNVENSSYGLTICAERVAFFKAISDGEREFEAIAIVSDGDDCMPCGACRQIMAEFCSPDFVVVLENKTFTLGELLPHAFEL